MSRSKKIVACPALLKHDLQVTGIEYTWEGRINDIYLPIKVARESNLLRLQINWLKGVFIKNVSAKMKLFAKPFSLSIP